jgi:hypothetical protein
MSGRNSPALVMAQKFCGLAADSADPNDLLIGERMIGVTKHYQGDQPSARPHIERVLAHHQASDYRAHIIPFQFDQRVSSFRGFCGCKDFRSRRCARARPRRHDRVVCAWRLTSSPTCCRRFRHRIWSEVEHADTTSATLAGDPPWVLESAGHVGVTGLPMLQHRPA